MSEWTNLDFLGFPNYEVSNTGKVKSLNYMRTGKEHLIHQEASERGYLKVLLHDKGKCKNFRVNRLVALAFLENPNNYKIVNHKDENPSNNNVTNLEWCTEKYNINYGTGLARRAEKQKGKIRKSIQRGNHSNAIKVKYENKKFECIKDLADYLKIDYGKLKHYIQERTYMPNILQGKIQIQEKDGTYRIVNGKIKENSNGKTIMENYT